MTGVARDQGRAHALALAWQGADIMGVDRVDTMDYPMPTQGDREQMRAEITAAGRRVPQRGRRSDRVGIESALATAVTETGRLDMVAANAGIAPPIVTIWEISSQRWDDVIGVNITGTFHTLAAALPDVRAGAAAQGPGSGCL